jgi:predicted transposase/invertase (TIGR01784 family)
MWPVFADPKTGFVFKRIFGAEDRKHLLIGLLNALLELDEAHRIVEVQHLPADQRIAISELKLSILDVKCTDAAGTRYVVEMQLLHVEGFEKRVVYNVAKAYAMQHRGGDDYPTLNDVVGVTICDFVLWPEKDEQSAFQIPMLSLWRMQEQHRGALGLSQLRFAFLELPKYTASSAPRTLVEKWAYFFREAKNVEVVPPVLAEQPFLEAFEVARVAHFTPEEWDAYDRAKIAEQDARGALTMAKRQAHDEGHQEGRREGLQEGRLLEKRAMLEKLLSGRELLEAHRTHIAACEDAAELDSWIDRAIAGATPAELFGA